jgi:hypothetical protein
VCVSGVKANVYNPRRNQISTTHRFNTPLPPPPNTFNGITPSFPGDRDLEYGDTVTMAERTKKNGIKTTSSVGV